MLGTGDEAKNAFAYNSSGSLNKYMFHAGISKRPIMFISGQGIVGK